jgi:hypothetical protein
MFRGDLIDFAGEPALKIFSRRFGNMQKVQTKINTRKQHDSDNEKMSSDALDADFMHT